HHAEVFGHFDGGETVLEFAAPAEVRSRLGAFQRDVPDHLRGVGRMRLDEVFRAGSGEAPERVDAIDVGTRLEAEDPVGDLGAHAVQEGPRNPLEVGNARHSRTRVYEDRRETEDSRRHVKQRNGSRPPVIAVYTRAVRLSAARAPENAVIQAGCREIDPGQGGTVRSRDEG